MPLDGEGSFFTILGYLAESSWLTATFDARNGGVGLGLCLAEQKGIDVSMLKVHRLMYKRTEGEQGAGRVGGYGSRESPRSMRIKTNITSVSSFPTRVSR